jgi:DNA-binding NarL/FixJ family response regulator
MGEIRIVVVDDHPLFRQGVVDIFSSERDISVVGQTDTGEEAIVLIRTLQPLIALLDVSLPGMNGLQVMRQISTEKLNTRVVFLTAYDDKEQLVHAMRSGASAYCAKDIQPERLVWVVREVAKGKCVLGTQSIEPSVLEMWLATQTESAVRVYGEPGEPYAPLSEREMEVLGFLAKGMSNKQIAVLLGISHQTVKNHVTSILRKLDVEDRTQAAIYALRHGWIRLY